MIVVDWMATMFEDMKKDGFVTLSEIMSDTLAQIQADPFFDTDMIYCDILVSLNFALLLGITDGAQAVHIQWEDDHYRVFYDYCGPGSLFYGQVTEIDEAGLLETVKDYIRRIAIETPDIDEDLRNN